MSAYGALQDVLAGDATLLALLPGGVYDGMEVKEITRQSTPAAYDAFGEVLPCAIIKPETQTPWGPHPDSSRLYVAIWFYAQNDYSGIDAGRQRVYTLLHRQQLSAIVGIYEVIHANDLLGIEIQGLDLAAIMSRYMLTVQR